jgi:hypothetical protein
MHARRWGDNDRHLGPFLFARDKRFKHLALVLSSGDDEDPGCSLRFSCYGFTVIIGLPQIVKPYMEKVHPVSWDAATVERLGRDWYWQVDEREYGFSLSEGHLSLRLGRQTHDSETTKSWGCFLPWTQWRYVRKSWYGLDGEHLRTDWESSDIEVRRNAWRIQREFQDAMPKAVFAFKDFDGEGLTATTHVGEMEWRFGTGYFKWLSLFRRAKVRRSLDIEFSGETGKRKGSWKGGTMGHSIDMTAGELHEAAFRRYCAEHDMTFIGKA